MSTPLLSLVVSMREQRDMSPLNYQLHGSTQETHSIYKLPLTFQPQTISLVATLVLP